MIGDIIDPNFEGWRGSAASVVCGDYPKVKDEGSTTILNFVTNGAVSDDYCKRWYNYVRQGNIEMFPNPPAWKALPVPPDSSTVDVSNYWNQITDGAVNTANTVEKQFMSNIVDTNAEHLKAKNPVDYTQLLTYAVIIGLGLTILKKV